MSRPTLNDFPAAFNNYINYVVGDTIQQAITNHSTTILNFVNNLDEAKADYKYAADKWTVKDVLQHLIDAERIFVYRALTFARKDAIDLPGYEENDYAANANTTVRTLQSLKDEFTFLRKSTDIFLLSLTEELLEQKGIANNNSITVKAIAFIIIGHNLHHKKVLEERYL